MTLCQGVHASMGTDGNLRKQAMCPFSFSNACAHAQVAITVINSQVLVWMGSMYAPALPLFGVAAVVLNFYVQARLTFA